MGRIVNLMIVALFTFSSGYAVKQFFFNIEKTSVKRIKKGLSKSEPFSRKLTGEKLNF